MSLETELEEKLRTDEDHARQVMKNEPYFSGIDDPREAGDTEPSFQVELTLRIGTACVAKGRKLALNEVGQRLKDGWKLIRNFDGETEWHKTK